MELILDLVRLEYKFFYEERETKIFETNYPSKNPRLESLESKIKKTNHRLTLLSKSNRL